MQDQPIWRELLSVDDPQLSVLAKSLFSTVLGSKAPSTAKKYVYAFNRWRKWAALQPGFSVFPVTSIQFSLYLQHLGETTKSRSAVEEAVYSISWIHQMAGVSSPADDPFVQTVLAGLRRSLAKPAVKKEPITGGVLEHMVLACGADPSLADVRFLAACLLAFAAFLRYDELADLQCTDISFHNGYIEVRIRSSKTDQYRQGSSVLVSRTDKCTCPVKMLEKYMFMGGLTQSSEGFLFRPLTRGGKELRPSGCLSYTRMRELLLERLESLGYPASQFGVHSLRSGGASAAAQAGVPDRLFKKHGRWRSEAAKDGYVKDSDSDRLKVSGNLGI